MPQARDRRSSPLDVATIYTRRRASILGISDLDPLFFGSSPRPERPTGSGGVGAPRNAFIGRGRGRAILAPGTENISPLRTTRRGRRGRGRASSSRRSVLPLWYPRTPLGDITAVVRAIERRSSHLVENEGQQTRILFSADQLLPDSSVSDFSAQLEHGSSVFSPKSVGVKFRTPAGSKVPKILLDIANQPEEGESDLLTPQKKLLNSIDKVEKVVREELQKLKRTPSAKKAEREKRVRTLMSMR